MRSNRESHSESRLNRFLFLPPTTFTKAISLLNQSLTFTILHTEQLIVARKHEKIVAKILELFTPLDTTGNDCLQALFSETRDYEDAVMIETVARSKIDCIVTRNTKDFTQSPISIYSPDQFIKLLSETN